MYIKGDAVRLDICWAAPNILGFFSPDQISPAFYDQFYYSICRKNYETRINYVSYGALLYE